MDDEKRFIDDETYKIYEIWKYESQSDKTKIYHFKDISKKFFQVLVN